jgi:hypothetical protein
MTPEQRQGVSKELRERVYGKDTADIRDSIRLKLNHPIFQKIFWKEGGGEQLNRSLNFLIIFVFDIRHDLLTMNLFSIFLIRQLIQLNQHSC